MSKINQRLEQTIIAFLLTLTLAITPVQAATTCKGEGQIACNKNSACGWIKAHKRKDGATVKAYCRAKPKKKTSLDSKNADSDTKKVKKTTEKKPKSLMIKKPTQKKTS
jgi:hypothetical protein